MDFKELAVTNTLRVSPRNLIVLVLLFLAASAAAAFTFTPMTASIAPSGSNAVITFKVTNDSASQIAVSIKVTTRVIDAAGNETNVAADKQFLVFPARVVLQPNSSQNIKVQYRGNAALPAEVAYRVMAEQLPVEFAKATTSGVNILLRYVAALYVAPAKIAPKLAFKSAITAEKDGKRGLTVTVANEGTKHALLSNPVLGVKQAGSAEPMQLTGETLAEIDGQNILAASTRTFFVPWDQAVPGASYEGSFSAEIE